MDNEFVKYAIIGTGIGLGLVYWQMSKAKPNPNPFTQDFPTQTVDKGSLAFGQDYVDNYAKQYAQQVLNDYVQNENKRGNQYLLTPGPIPQSTRDF